MDNLRAHKVKGVRLLHLPPYSADFNPIEMAWSKLKGFSCIPATARNRWRQFFLWRWSVTSAPTDPAPIPSLVKTSLSIAGVALIITGTIWFLQGINVLPGSFMTGQTKWAVIGAVCFILGLGSLAASRWV